MKILLIHNDYQQAGGEAVAVQAQIALLEKHGHKVIRFFADNKDIEAYSVTEKAAFFVNTVFSQKTATALQIVVEDEKPELAHVHNVFPLLSPSVYIALKTLHIPIVQTIHNFRLMCPNALFLTKGEVCERCKFGNMMHAVRLRCYRDSYLLSGLYALSIGLHRQLHTFQGIDRFITLTQFAAEKLIESGIASSSRITVLGNFLPEPLPAPGPEFRKPYIVYMGRLAPEKGVSTLVKAMKGIDGLQAKICGTGPQQHELELLASEIGLENVEFIGYVSGEAKWELLRNALVSIVPSNWYEHLPFAILESWAVETPVIVSALGSLGGLIVHGQDGLTFPPNNADALHQLLQTLPVQSAQLREMGRQGRQRVIEQFSESSHYLELFKIYDQLVAKS